MKKKICKKKILHGYINGSTQEIMIKSKNL